MSKIELTLEEAREIFSCFDLALYHDDFDGGEEEKLRECDAALALLKSKIESLEYDPKNWNEYPKITPPPDVMMRVECEGRYKLGAKFYSEIGWRDPYGNCVDDVVRFRPWED